MKSETYLAYLAGIFDGEGCVNLTTTGTELKVPILEAKFEEQKLEDRMVQ